jgi:hypothetical protein
MLFRRGFNDRIINKTPRRYLEYGRVSPKSPLPFGVRVRGPKGQGPVFPAPFILALPAGGRDKGFCDTLYRV